MQPAPLRWRNWPLVDCPRWSWLGVVLPAAAGSVIWWMGGGWLLSLSAVAGLAATLWQLFLPIDYEIGASGIRRHALRRTRLLPWHSIRAYQPRSGGIVMFQRSDPAQVDALCSVFVPYPADADALLYAVRPHLSHAVELPNGRSDA